MTPPVATEAMRSGVLRLGHHLEIVARIVERIPVSVMHNLSARQWPEKDLHLDNLDVFASLNASFPEWASVRHESLHPSWPMRNIHNAARPTLGYFDECRVTMKMPTQIMSVAPSACMDGPVTGLN